MTPVITRPPVDPASIYSDEVDNNFTYLVEYRGLDTMTGRSTLQFAFITREQYQVGHYHTHCLGKMTNGNNFSDTDNYHNLTDLIDIMLKRGHKVYQFTTWQEMIGYIHANMNKE